MLTPSAARRAIDDAVYDTLGLMSDNREAVYDGVTELVQNHRRRGEESVRGTMSTPSRSFTQPHYRRVIATSSC